MNGENDDKLKGKLEAIRALQEIIERLRGPDGCPWDRAQTIPRMAPNLLEEACETVDAIERGQGEPTPAILEELGDLLMNVLLTARIAEEGGGFSIREVAEMISAKLIRRHPHVFGDERAATVEDVLKRWNAIKAEEGEKNSSLLSRIPRSLPTLPAAVKVGKVAGDVGFDWPDAPSAFEKVEEEVQEVKRALQEAKKKNGRENGENPSMELYHEVGDLLFASVNLARKAGIDPDRALRSAIDRFSRRFRFIEERIDVSRASLEEMEALWNQAKKNES